LISEKLKIFFKGQLVKQKYVGNYETTSWRSEMKFVAVDRVQNCTDGPPFEENLSGPVVVDGEPELDDVEADVLVEGVEDHFRVAGVEPGAVNEKETRQESGTG
jgi:hypothetical protein